MSETIALVSCVKQKRASACAAQDLYGSTLFRLARAYAERHADRWFILSARYGLVHPQQVIEPYEQTLTDASAADRRSWAAHVYGQMAEPGLLSPDVSFLWLAGNNYHRDLAQLLAQHQQHDPLHGRRFGERLAWLKRSTAPP